MDCSHFNCASHRSTVNGSILRLRGNMTETCERCGMLIRLEDIEVSDDNSFVCPWCGHEQVFDDSRDADEGC